MRQLTYPADDGRSYEDIEKMARIFQEAFAPGRPATEPFDVVRTFEDLEARPVRARGGRMVDVTYDVQPLPVEGLTRFEPEDQRIVVMLDEQTYAKLERNEGRARFTGAHEFGHVTMHRNELLRMSSIPHRLQNALCRDFSPQHSVHQDIEWQADAFASALLMPAVGIYELGSDGRLPSADEVMQRFLVSRSAAQTRLAAFSRHGGHMIRAWSR